MRCNVVRCDVMRCDAMQWSLILWRRDAMQIDVADSQDSCIRCDQVSEQRRQCIVIRFTANTNACDEMLPVTTCHHATLNVIQHNRD